MGGLGGGMIWFVPLNECFKNLDASKYYNIYITCDYIIMKRQDVIKTTASAVAVGEIGIFQPLPWRRVVTLCEWVGPGGERSQSVAIRGSEWDASRACYSVQLT